MVTQALIAINVIVFLAETAAGAPLGGGGGGTIWNHGVLLGPPLTAHNPTAPFNGTHEYWRLVTGGFLHDGLLHIGINMLSLYFVGVVLEPAIGRVNFVVDLLRPRCWRLVRRAAVPARYADVGASGAIFGVFGALIVVARYRGDPDLAERARLILLVST